MLDQKRSFWRFERSQFWVGGFDSFSSTLTIVQSMMASRGTLALGVEVAMPAGLLVYTG
jgi:hypothetical protein